MHDWLSKKNETIKALVTYCNSRISNENRDKLLTRHQISHTWNKRYFGGLVNCEIFDAHKLKCKFFIILYATEGNLDSVLLKNELLAFRASEDFRFITLRNSRVVAWQQYGHHIWSQKKLKIWKHNFHHPSYNSLSWTKGFSPQKTQDIPSLHWSSRQSELSRLAVDKVLVTGLRKTPNSTM
jgi:hypothetical protein